ncbi:hypothetical protein DLAC_05129 [Tieghemostelium lacteum]|uniref:Major facilitator superfamily (MFS) profile domain-containing protein n=1 Tax=Tieghemostelium lacteum TaxID=361077 RepID=A0A151ZIM8_TIELA|nr:hypothetical protein DLAC_05129 [Tieghemostelium lacteum]|eukprot:KYQ93740.1 hypothetical protein DLAC_05129 [Tieghemostelium lacteum]
MNINSKENDHRISILGLSLVNVFGGLIFGYNTGVIAGVLNLPEFKSYSDINKGILTCSLLIGAMVGSLVAGYVLDKLGRKRPMAIFAIVSIVGSVGSSFVPTHLWYMVPFRFILGLSVGVCAVVCPNYVGEMSPPERKGTLGTLFQIAITVGILIGDIVGFALQHVKYDYRLMFGLGFIPGLCLFLLVPNIPESTKWKNQKEQETTLLLKDKQIKSLGIREIISSPIGRFSMFIGLILAINNQLTGINSFIYFSPSIFEEAGISSGNGAMLATIGLMAWNVITTFIATFLIDRIGRRKLMIYGSLIMTISCLVIAILFLTIKGTALGVLSIILLFMFIMGFEAGAGPLFWILVIEIFPEDMRDTGSSVLNAIQWIFNITLSFSFLQLVNLIGQSSVFFVFFAIGVFCLVTIILKLPETKPNI